MILALIAYDCGLNDDIQEAEGHPLLLVVWLAFILILFICWRTWCTADLGGDTLWEPCQHAPIYGFFVPSILFGVYCENWKLEYFARALEVDLVAGYACIAGLSYLSSSTLYRSLWSPHLGSGWREFPASCPKAIWKPSEGSSGIYPLDLPLSKSWLCSL